MKLFSNINHITSGLALFSIGAVTTGCGTGEGQQLVRNFQWTLADNAVTLDTEFSTEVTLNVEVEVPVKEYGVIRFVPATAEKGFRIVTDLNLGAFVDSEILRLRKTATLPNGRPFHTFVASELNELRFKLPERPTAYGYFGLETGKRYLGAAVDLTFVDKEFPEGLSVSQQIVDSSQRVLGVVTLYGPQMENGTVKVPGGVFLVTNLSTLSHGPSGQSAGGLQPSPFEVTGPNASEYQNPNRLWKLFKLFRDRARTAD